MEKIKIDFKDIKKVIKEFYEPKVYHFLTLNGVAISEDEIEVQWLFSKYENMDEVIVYFDIVKDDVVIPSIVEIIPSAIISQRELVDMFGLKVEDSEAGLYLDEDSLQKPLNLGCAI